MATGGAARVSVKGSDEFHLFMCSRCSRNEINVGAEVYCIQCQEYMCGKCHSNHNSFTMMAAHTMLDRAQMEARGPQGSQLAVPCDLHPGETYILFCKNHDQVCCAICSRIHHKSCNVRYILDVVKGARQGPELDAFRQDVNDLMQQLEKVKKNRELGVDRMVEEKKTEIDNIQTSVRQLIEQLKELEKTAINEVTRKFTELKTNIESDVVKLDITISTFNTKLDQLEKSNDEIEKFVHMKICKENKSSAMILIEDIEARAEEERLIFLIDERIGESIGTLRSLGQMVLDYQYAPTLEGQHSMDQEEDGQVCSVNDVCLAQDGSFLVTDGGNECLKRLNQKYSIIGRLELAGTPGGVCAVSTDQAAVCLLYSNMVQLIALNPTMRTLWSFTTTATCRLIAYQDDHLYVACGGQKDLFNDGPGHIAVYTILGELVRKLQSDIQGRLFSSIPMGVTLRTSDEVILVCDWEKGLVALNPDGQRLWTRKLADLDMIKIGRVTLDDHGQALVSSMGSSKVVMVGKDGKKGIAVLTARDGINRPTALCFDSTLSRLILTEEKNNKLSVFKLTKIRFEN